jgi:Lrp/AsnC family leucine-responsive transcriptional regulator
VPDSGEAVSASGPTKRRRSAIATDESQLLDPINRRLLQELQADARVTIAELGRRINLSAPAVAERVQRLERAGVITGYRAEVDPKAIGFPIAAVVRVRPTTRQLQKIPELAREIPEVVDCHRITGEDCFFVKLHLRSMDDLEEILDRFIVLGQTTTSIIHSSPLAQRPLPLEPDYPDQRLLERA